MNLADAKIVLGDLLDKQISDSLITIYEARDKINASTITLQISQIKLLQQKSSNQELLASNLEKIVSNKDTEITLLNDVIKKQKKEIRKQKFLKIMGFTAAVVLPVIIIIVLTK